VLVRFDLVDGAPGEAESLGTLRPGLRVSHLNDQAVLTAPFPSIVAALVNCGRPVRISFRDPEVPEFRDRRVPVRARVRSAVSAAPAQHFHQRLA
jgi:hypothetical protein